MGLIIYSCFRVFIGAVLIVSLWLIFTSFACCENGYIPRYHYFFRYLFFHSYQDRLELDRQYECAEYVRIGEGVFLEDYLLFVDFGVILRYSEIESIVLSQIRNLNVVSIHLKDGGKYCFNISEPEYKGGISLYSKALQHYQSKK